MAVRAVTASAASTAATASRVGGSASERRVRSDSRIVASKRRRRRRASPPAARGSVRRRVSWRRTRRVSRVSRWVPVRTAWPALDPRPWRAEARRSRLRVFRRATFARATRETRRVAAPSSSRPSIDLSSARRTLRTPGRRSGARRARARDLAPDARSRGRPSSRARKSRSGTSPTRRATRPAFASLPSSRAFRHRDLRHRDGPGARASPPWGRRPGARGARGRSNDPQAPATGPWLALLRDPRPARRDLPVPGGFVVIPEVFFRCL